MSIASVFRDKGATKAAVDSGPKVEGVRFGLHNGDCTSTITSQETHWLICPHYRGALDGPLP